MFDPFKDFETAGYLRNKFQQKDPAIIKEIEHQTFKANLMDAIAQLSHYRSISYDSFLETHKTLFQDFYPWAGQDRKRLVPDVAVSKGPVMFAHPNEVKRAVDYGLQLATDPNSLKKRLGEVMGLFAYAHPFLDGNGRTLILVYSELCHRAGFSVAWGKMQKDEYLNHLTSEISKPGKGVLDSYLGQFIRAKIDRNLWGATVTDLAGLKTGESSERQALDYSDPSIKKQYEEFLRKREYSYQTNTIKPKSSGLSR